MTRRESATWAVHRPVAALIRVGFRVADWTLDRIDRRVCDLSNRIGGTDV